MYEFHHFYSKGPVRVYQHPKGIPFFKCGWRPGITESFTRWKFDSELTPEKLQYIHKGFSNHPFLGTSCWTPGVFTHQRLGTQGFFCLRKKCCPENKKETKQFEMEKEILNFLALCW